MLKTGFPSQASGVGVPPVVATGVGLGAWGVGSGNSSCTGGGTPPLRTPTITIRTQVFNRDWVRICIEDNGSGITESVKQQLFDPFFTTKPVGKGTGLGLSISYQIVVEKHGGKLECISEPGQGAEFWIEIPIQQSSTVHPSFK